VVGGAVVAGLSTASDTVLRHYGMAWPTTGTSSDVGSEQAGSGWRVTSNEYPRACRGGQQAGVLVLAVDDDGLWMTTCGLCLCLLSAVCRLPSAPAKRQRHGLGGNPKGTGHSLNSLHLAAAATRHPQPRPPPPTARCFAAPCACSSALPPTTPPPLLPTPALEPSPRPARCPPPA
jgi:hypothetical protein